MNSMAKLAHELIYVLIIAVIGSGGRSRFCEHIRRHKRYAGKL
jgi:hypothetical protein